MKRALSVISLLGLALVAGLPSASDAQARPPTMMRGRPPMAAPLVSVILQSTNGMALPTAMMGGRTFVAGEQGDRYEIAIQNNTADRIEVVVSVDGRDAVSGRLGDFTTQRGYVVQPFGRVVIDGFRTSMDAVAAFRFASVSGSFAGRMGTPQHAGVIGVAVFREQAQRIAGGMRPGPMTKKRARSSSGFVPFDADAAAPREEGRAAPSAPGAGASPSRDRAASARRWGSPAPTRELGTAFGEHRFSAARQVTFVRANARRPDFTTELQYDTPRALAARGVPIEVTPVFVAPPPGDAWPGATDRRFTAPPP